MIFFKFMFMLLLTVPIAVFMIYLLGRMIDALNVSVKNDAKNKTAYEKSRRPDAKSYGHTYEYRRNAYADKTPVRNTADRAAAHGSVYGEKELEPEQRDSKRKRRKARKIRRNEKKDREQ